MRIAISGKMASGKSLVATYLVEHYGFTELSFASKLKEVVADLFPHCRYEKDRWLLIQVGELLRGLDPRVWIRHLIKEVGGGNIVVSDLRYPLEYDTLKRAQFITVRMKASYESRLDYIKHAYPDMPLMLMDDSSETALDHHPFDYEICNDADVTMEQVYAQVDNMIKGIEKHE